MSKGPTSSKVRFRRGQPQGSQGQSGLDREDGLAIIPAAAARYLHLGTIIFAKRCFDGPRRLVDRRTFIDPCYNAELALSSKDMYTFETVRMRLCPLSPVLPRLSWVV